MDLARRRRLAAALLGATLIACRGESAGKPAADTASVRPTAVRPESAAAQAATATPATADVLLAVAPEARAVCAAVARFWGKFDSTQVRQTDSTTAPYAAGTTVAACVVLTYQEHGNRPNAPVDTAAQRLEYALALVRGAGEGWVPLYRFQADGPDGGSMAYQRGRVRCLVERGIDGGDDSDSTYVPADWFRENTTCWLMPRDLAVSDTAQGR